MNFYKLIKKAILFNLFTLNVILASDKFEFLDFPNEIIQHVSSFLTEKENGVFRQISKHVMGNVDQVYITKIGKNFNNPESSILVEEAAKDKDFSLFRQQYIYNITSNKSKTYLEKHKYLFVSQGSIFEGYLAKNYTRVPLYEYLQNQPEISKNLYNKLFGKEIPEDQYDLAVKLLTGCLPANHIYVDKETKAEEYPQLLNKFQAQLAQAIQGNKFKYFLLGIDKNYEDLDEAYNIVINQSNLECLPQLKNRSYNTIIFNTDQAELSFPNPPKNMKKLVLVNGNKLCTFIKSFFLGSHENLESFDTKGLINVHTIGAFFLSYCQNLKTFDTKGLINLHTIKAYFLSFCKNLKTFDTEALTSLHTIEWSFLSNCKSLGSFNTKGLINVKIISDDFLEQCKSLESFNTEGLINVHTIKSRFLFDCQNLKSFNTEGLINLHTIGNDFLFNCSILENFDTNGMINLQIIGNDFLFGYKKLKNFNTEGLINVKTIGDGFLRHCEKIDGVKIKEMLLQNKKQIL